MFDYRLQEYGLLPFTDAGRFNTAAPVSDNPFNIPLPGLGGAADYTVNPFPGVTPTVNPYQGGGLIDGTFDDVTYGQGMQIDPIIGGNTNLGGSPQTSQLPPDPVFKSNPSTSMIYPHSPFPDMGGLIDFNQMAVDSAGIQPAMRRNIEFAGPQNRMLDEMLAREKERAAQLGGTPEWIENIGDALGSPGTLFGGLFSGLGGLF